MTDTPDWQVPLLRLTNNLANGSNVVIPASNGIVPVLNVPISQPSYEVTIAANLPAGLGTVPFLSITLAWQDAATGLTTDTEVFWVICGNGPTHIQTTYLQGPCRGSQLGVSIANPDPAQAVTVTYTISQTSLVFAYDRLAQPVMIGIGPIGFTYPSGNPNIGVLAMAAPAIPILLSTSLLIAAWSGTALLSVDNLAGDTPITARLLDPANLYGGAVNGELFGASVAQGTVFNATVALPQGPVVLKLTNNSPAQVNTPLVGLVRVNY